MKSAAIVLAALLVAAPAHAQLGGIMNKVQKAQDAKKKIDDLIVTDKEERQIGDDISTKLRDRFGVYQDADVTKYVSLVGSVLAQASSRPNLDWKFIVLDTDGVNAFAAPGGLIHVTRGLLGLMKTESQLAGVLGHEITHVTAKHTVHAIQQTAVVKEGKERAGSGSTWTTEMMARAANQVYEKLYMNDWSRDQEQDADEGGVRLANKVGYAPSGLSDTLKLIADRNKGHEDKNGLFASHPATQERIAKVGKQIASERLTAKAVQQPRYAKNITFDVKPLAQVATDTSGAAGLAGGSTSANDKDKKDTKDADKKSDDSSKKKGGLLGKFTTSSSDQKQSSQTIASAGARGVGPDRDAKGGSNKSPVNVRITPAELDAFKKGIVA
jgi:predicted Zn-dependent protease